MEHVFIDTLSNVDLLISNVLDIKGHANLDGNVPDLAKFWSDLITASKALSHEATKFAIAHSPPFPDALATKQLATHLFNAASHLAGAYLLLPSSVGSTLLRCLSRELCKLFSSLKQFIESVKKIVINKEPVESCLITTGIIWDFCDQIPSLPRNNNEAVILILGKEEQLVMDALHELEQARLVYDGDVASSSDDEFNEDSVIQGLGIAVLPSVKGLIKSTVGCLRKTKKLLKKLPSQFEPTRLDALVDPVSSLSTQVDDVVCSMYSPVNSTQLVDNALVLATSMRHILVILKTGIGGEEDQQWMAFLNTAIDHNVNNLQAKAQPLLLPL